MLSERGFTLAEVLIAIAIFAIAVIGLAAMSGNAIRGLDSAKKLSAAVNLAEAKLEALKMVSYDNLEASGSDGGITRTCVLSGSGCSTTYTCTPSTGGAHSYPENINNVDYTWYWTAQIIDVNGDLTCSSSGDGLKKVIMTAAWTDAFGSRTLQLTTMRAK